MHGERSGSHRRHLAPLPNFVSESRAFARVCVPGLTTFVSELDVSPLFPTRRLTTFMSASSLVWDTNSVKTSLFTVKDFTFVLSTRRQDVSLSPIASDWRPACHRSDGKLPNPSL